MRAALVSLAFLATALCAPADSLQASTVEDLLRAAAQAHSAGKSAEALALADKAVARDPKSTRPYVFRGSLRESQGRYAEAVADYSQAVTLDARAAEAYDRRGSAYFKLGQFAKSVADFDRFLELRPAERPGHWRRGISLYYAGRYEDGQKQFEGYEQLDTNDVENAVWCYLCAAKRLGVDKARAALLKIGKDRRVPMMEVYALFSGRAKPADVLAATQAGNPPAGLLKQQQFYAHLYLGLYYDCIGDAKQALEHLERAVQLRLGHYMWEVARVHRDVLANKQQGR
jgi:lipoprotein NlpI